MSCLKHRRLMRALNARVGLSVLALIIALALQGCESLRKGEQADGILDFVMILANTAKPDVAPIERDSTGDGEIATARAVADRGGRASVRGSVKKHSGAGWVSGAFSHVDVLVLNSHRDMVESHTTTFSPSLIPVTQRGIEGRAHYHAALETVPPPGSVIRVVFHNIPREHCEHYRPNG
jgi:hypothetical protein